MSQPPLRALHPDDSLLRLKLEQFRQLSTEILLDSLAPGKPGAMKVRPDGTIVDGHHRIAVLRERSVDVNTLPREIVRRVE